MRSFLKKLHNQPEAVRWKVAIFVASALMVIIIALWIVALSGRFSENRESTPKQAKPFSAMKESFSDFDKSATKGFFRRNR